MKNNLLSSIGDRIKYLRKYYRLNAKAFANKLLISRGYVTKLENNTKYPSKRLIVIICTTYNINENWLRTGEGEMLIKQDLLSIAETSAQYGISNRLTEYIDKLNVIKENGLTEERARIFGLIDAVYDDIKKRCEQNCKNEEGCTFPEKKEILKKPA